MIVGVPAEIKDNENRIAMVPGGAAQLISHGHSVLVESRGGEGSGFLDEDYLAVGAEIVGTADEVFQRADMIVKVKEPQPVEWGRMRPDQIVFTYFHFAASEELTKGCLETGSICVAYETIEDEQGRLPLLTPMSEVAGRMATQVGAFYLEKPEGGRGVLLGGVPGTPPADVVVIGGIASNPQSIRACCAKADLLIGAVLIEGAKAPVLVPREYLADMKEGSVIVDVAVDQGGCVETCHPTTHSDPTYVVDGVLHYCVANMPGAVPRTSTFALSNATMPYAVRLANEGVTARMLEEPGFAAGINEMKGKVTYPAVAEAFGMDYTPVADVLK